MWFLFYCSVLGTRDFWPLDPETANWQMALLRLKSSFSEPEYNCSCSLSRGHFPILSAEHFHEHSHIHKAKSDMEPQPCWQVPLSGQGLHKGGGLFSFCCVCMDCCKKLVPVSTVVSSQTLQLQVAARPITLVSLPPSFQIFRGFPHVWPFKFTSGRLWAMSNPRTTFSAIVRGTLAVMQWKAAKAECEIGHPIQLPGNLNFHFNEASFKPLLTAKTGLKALAQSLLKHQLIPAWLNKVSCGCKWKVHAFTFSITNQIMLHKRVNTSWASLAKYNKWFRFE